MRKIFFLATFILTLFTATALAAEATDNPTDKGYPYVSQTYGFKILCPAEPKVVVNPFEDPDARGELLVFANDGIKIIYGYQIQLNAFNSDAVPDFNKDKQEVIDAYIEKLGESNMYDEVKLVKISKDNKGIMAVTSKEIEVTNEQGEVEGVLVADTQSAITFFRTPNGNCVSIQLLASELNEENRENYFKSLVSFEDAASTDKNKKSSTKSKDKKKSDKKSKS